MSEPSDLHASLGALSSETCLCTPDGRYGRLRRYARGIAIDIEWGHATERWAAELDAASIEQTLAGYEDSLRQAGFRPVLPADELRPPARLDARAAHAFARDLVQRGDLRGKVAEADLRGDATALRLACQRVHDGSQPKNLAFDAFEQNLFALGRTLWLFDDDGIHGRIEPDSMNTMLVAWLARHQPTQIHLHCFDRLGRVLDRLLEHGVLSTLTHLIVVGASDLGAIAEPPPGLLALTADVKHIDHWLATAPPTLEALTLFGGLGRATRYLEGLDGLRHLGLWYASSDEVTTLLAHPIVERLETLDLFMIGGARGFPFDELRARGEQLAHLRRLFVPGHLVPDLTRARFAEYRNHVIADETRAQFGDWPQLRFVSYDRLETLGYDLLAIGFPRATL